MMHITSRTSRRSADAGPVSPTPAGAPENWLIANLERFGLVVLLVLVIVMFSFWAPNTFPTASNFQIVTTSVAVLAVAAMALLFPLIAGRFDVSVGANVGLCAVASASAMSKYGLPLIAAIAVAVVIGTLVGVVNGVVVAYLGVNSIISTIGTSTAIGGIVQGYTGGLPIQFNLSTTLTDLPNEKILGVPSIFVVTLVLCLVSWYVLTQTPFGRYLFATGSNITAARLNGVAARRIIFRSFVVSGLISGLAGVMQVAAQGSGDPNVGGLPFLLPALAAVFLGATTIRPGRYNVPGTIIALIFVATVTSGLILIGLKPWVSDVFNGVAVVAAIALSAQIQRRRTGAVDIGG